EAADVLMAIEQFDLAKKYFERAQADGADPESVSVGLANAYLALGETQSAGQLLQSMANTPESSANYAYLVALGNDYRKQQDPVQAWSAFARANRLDLGT